MRQRTKKRSGGRKGNMGNQEVQMKFTMAHKEAKTQQPLPRKQVMAVDAAEGWLMLGNPSAAAEDLEKVSDDYYYHPRVLAVRWQIYAASKCWEAAWIVSAALCEIAPDYAPGWICQANALREYKGLRGAKKLLLSVVHRFPNDAVIPYNIACFACQLGQISDACKWLLRAFDLEKNVELKVMALCDPDLDPLWQRIAESTVVVAQGDSEDDDETVGGGERGLSN